MLVSFPSGHDPSRFPDIAGMRVDGSFSRSSSVIG
jgi:hypothetical protein